MNRKGFVQDILFFGVILLIVAICIIFGMRWLSGVNDNLQTSDDLSTEGKDIMQNNVDRFAGVWDGIFMFLIIIMGIGIIVSIAMLPTHPLFFFVGIALAVFTLIVVAIIGNSYDDVATNPELSDTVDDFSLLDWFMSHIVESMAVFIVLGFIIMYMGANR